MARLPLLNRFTRTNQWALAVEERLNLDREPAHRITHGLHLLSRLVDGYKDLAELDACVGGPPPGPDAGAAAAATAGNNNAGLLVPRPFLACLEEGWVPQSARVEGGVFVPILGLMEVLAASRLLADTDVLGGSATNDAGFVVKRDGDGHPLAVRVVKVRA